MGPVKMCCDQDVNNVRIPMAVCNKTLCDDMSQMNNVIGNIDMLTSRILLTMFGEKSKEHFDSSASECMADDIVKCVKNLEQIMRKLEKIDSKLG